MAHRTPDRRSASGRSSCRRSRRNSAIGSTLSSCISRKRMQPMSGSHPLVLNEHASARAHTYCTARTHGRAHAHEQGGTERLNLFLCGLLHSASFSYDLNSACRTRPIGPHINIKQPKTTAERVSLAQQQLAALGVGDEFTRLVDDVESNGFHAAYACWPLRWYTVAAGPGRQLTSIAQPRASGYDINELISWIVRTAVARP